MGYMKMECSKCHHVYAGSDPQIVMEDYYQHYVDEHKDAEDWEEAKQQLLELRDEIQANQELVKHYIQEVENGKILRLDGEVEKNDLIPEKQPVTWFVVKGEDQYHGFNPHNGETDSFDREDFEQAIELYNEHTLVSYEKIVETDQPTLEGFVETHQEGRSP